MIIESSMSPHAVGLFFAEKVSQIVERVEMQTHKMCCKGQRSASSTSWHLQSYLHPTVLRCPNLMLVAFPLCLPCHHRHVRHWLNSELRLEAVQTCLASLESPVTFPDSHRDYHLIHPGNLKSEIGTQPPITSAATGKGPRSSGSWMKFRSACRLPRAQGILTSCDHSESFGFLTTNSGDSPS